MIMFTFRVSFDGRGEGFEILCVELSEVYRFDWGRGFVVMCSCVFVGDLFTNN